MGALSVLNNIPWINVNNLALLLGGLIILLLMKLSGNLRYIGNLFKNAFSKSEKGIERKSKRNFEGVLCGIRCKYGLTKHGFLPEYCLEKLPDYFKEWEDIARKLPELNRLEKLRNEVVNMRLLSCDNLQTEAMLRRAYILLGMLVHSYVNGKYAAWDRLKGSNETGIDDGEARKSESCVATKEVKTLVKEGVISAVNDYTGSCNGDMQAYGKDGGSNGSYKQEMNGNKTETCGNPSYTDPFFDIPCVPHQLAIPWFIVCKRLDLPLVLTAALDLWNWKLKEETQPHELSNLTSMITMSQTESEINFHMVPCAMHFVAASIMPQIFILYDDIREGTKDKESAIEVGKSVLGFVVNLTGVYKKLKAILRKVKDLVDVDIFYDVYRPLLNGFWPDGVLFQLVSDDDILVDDCEDNNHSDDNGNDKYSDNFHHTANDPSILSCQPGDSKDGIAQLEYGETVGIMDDTNVNRKSTVNAKSLDFITHDATAFDSVIKRRLPKKGVIACPKGPSAGQSTMIFLFDLILGIKHQGSGKDFQDEMINYLPVPHRKMVIDLKYLVEQYGTLRDVIIQSADVPIYGKCVNAYNECIRAVADFRALHLGIAVKYLVRTRKGTGASSFRDMLNEMASSTKHMTIEA